METFLFFQNCFMQFPNNLCGCLISGNPDQSTTAGIQNTNSDSESGDSSNAVRTENYPNSVRMESVMESQPNEVAENTNSQVQTESIEKIAIVFENKDYQISDCNICYLENQKGINMTCCKGSKFICLNCYMYYLLRIFNKTGTFPFETILGQDIKILQEYIIKCPFCQQKTKLENVELVEIEITRILIDTYLLNKK